MCKCTNLMEFLQTEIDIIQTNIDMHKYLRGIADEQEAIAVFVRRYAWIMKIYYCKFVCPKRQDCCMKE